MRPLISVIIPIYKVENYLEKCVDSILGQTYENIEIILVDDGSPDTCGEICEAYAEKDKRIRVIHKKNGGLSDARNAGLKICRGEYIVFVDSDDWMEQDGIEILYNLAQENTADLVIGGVEKVEDGTETVIWSTYDGSQKTVVHQKQEEVIKDMMLNGCASWARLYRRVIHENVFFPVGEINEDEAIVLELYRRCNTIVKTNQVVYKYRYRSQSITSTTWHKKKMDWYFHCKKNLSLVQKYYPEIEKYAEARYCSSIIWCLNNMTIDIKKFENEIVQLKAELKSVLNKVYRTRGLNNKEILRGYMLAYAYGLYTCIVKILGKKYT